MDYFCADHHFGHAAIVDLARRPYQTLAEMTEDLIAKHNERVTERDCVYMLGDIAFKLPPRHLAQILQRMRGRKKLIFGNHDRTIIKKAERKGLLDDLCHRGRVSVLGDYYEIKVKWKGHQTKVILFHCPILTWPSKSYGSYHLHGHCHGHLEDTKRRSDVGVDCWNYYPAALPEILERCDRLGEEQAAKAAAVATEVVPTGLPAYPYVVPAEEALFRGPATQTTL